MATPFQPTTRNLDTMLQEARDGVVDLATRAKRNGGFAMTGESVDGPATEPVQAAGNEVPGGAENAADGGGRQVANAAETVTREAKRAKKMISRAAASTSDRIVASPLRSVLLVGLTGFLLGLSVRGLRD